MSAFGSRTARPRAARAAVKMQASVVTMSAYQFPELLDISQTGAKLCGSALPPVNTTGLLRIGSFQTLCRVVWVADEQCGVRFDEPAPYKVLKEIQLQGTASLESQSAGDTSSQSVVEKPTPKPEPARVDANPVDTTPFDPVSARLLDAVAQYEAIVSEANSSSFAGGEPLSGEVGADLP